MNKIGRFAMNWLDGIPLLAFIGMFILAGVFCASGKSFSADYLLASFGIVVVLPCVGYSIYHVLSQMKGART